jgi:two-component system, NtrC family, response regulator HydG
VDRTKSRATLLRRMAASVRVVRIVRLPRFLLTRPAATSVTLQLAGSPAFPLQTLPFVFAFLTMTTGARVGAHFPLRRDRENRLGRGLDCDVVLSDPLASRVHAIVVREGDQWLVRDLTSRNGTYVNGQKIDEASLLDDCRLRVGSTEFLFRESEHKPSGLLDSRSSSLGTAQTIIREFPVDLNDLTKRGIEALQNLDRAQDLLMLYQLSIKLLGATDPDEVVRVALELLQHRTKATVAAFLWLTEDRQLKPRFVVPEDAASTTELSEDLTDSVVENRKPLWTGHKYENAGSDAPADFADAICVPMTHDGEVFGAVHLYRRMNDYTESEFEFAVSLTNIMGVALVRARRQATLKVQHERLVDKAAAFDELIGDSKPMTDLKSRIARVARATGCVLVRGESGAGKELVARAIHRTSPRADRPLLSVNCAAIPPELMESQLFGHKKGSFTGADADHVGWFQQAHTGTLFLDEVGELTLEGQAKLLRILEGHPFLPVGSTKEVKVDVRVIAATNRDLREFVRDKRFREDLYYRLSVFELYIPPLRDRGPDIARLLDFFLEHFKRQHGRPNLQLVPAARERLLGYNWPGNVRQLRNVIDSAVVMADGNEIGSNDLGLRDAGMQEMDTLRLDAWEQKLIAEALRRADGNVPEAARLLGLGRATLYRKIEEYGIDRK